MFGSYQRFVVHVNTLIDKIVERGQEMMWEWDQERVWLHDVYRLIIGYSQCFLIVGSSKRKELPFGCNNRWHRSETESAGRSGTKYNFFWQEQD